MAKLYTAKEALDIVMESDCEDGSSSSSSDSEADTEEASESEVDTEQLESSSSSADSSEEAEVEEEERWTSKNGKILWSATNNQTLRYIPAARGLVPGPTQYAAARIRDPITSFSLLLTAEIIQHILAVTNLHGRREITGWRDLDVEELQAYMGLIILAGVYRSKDESTLSLWSEKSGRTIFRATMSHKRFHHIGRALRFDDKLSRPRR
ncbi:hypothetical protein D5F01_LYC23789 [Larimichthys crocea]|uniref:PiggyBac transposable element-derived protein domain-containing protein n=1 Tax=Larimichthys crocea TaxID=215358 RepID=A0A6G0HFY4_LARCR|nr:hypothetical protein D5F01_LYC23789 [Larimichthys crocea]